MTRKEARIIKAQRRAASSLLSFMAWCWWMPHVFKIGRHTRAICDRLTQAVEDFREGKSTYLLIAVPFRHGKSDIVSRALPAYFLGRCADMEPDVIMTGYGKGLVAGFSKKIKSIIRSVRYQILFPSVKLAQGSNSVSEWQIADSAGVVTAEGLAGSIVGKGGHLIVLDDYCKRREEAVSVTYRDKVWDGFRNDILTRQNSPASIVIVCATPWHVDDLRGRIKAAMVEDKSFPQFEEMKFPATKQGEYDYLFPEMFDAAWYEAQRAALQKQAAAQLDCEPFIEGGNVFNMNHIQIHQTLDGWPVRRETRGWDLASSTKQLRSDNPDRTWGIRGHVETKTLGYRDAKQHHIWISSMVFCREEAPKRNALIQATARADGPGVAQHVEAFGAYKDAFTTLKSVLSGVCVVHKSNLPGDKSAKLSPLEPSFDAGLVHIYAPGCARGALDLFIKELSDFPEGDHDDGPDAMGVMFHSQVKRGAGIGALI